MSREHAAAEEPFSRGQNAVQRAALAYAKRFGFAVLPCQPGGKTPLTEHGGKDATKSPAQIREWWERWPEANVGIATGAISGIVVLDIDPRHGGDGTLEALQAEHGKLPDTPTVLTGGGGFHFYFRHPGGGVPNSAAKVGQGIDVRSDGGYIIAPKSLHESGNRYLWEVTSRIDEMPLAELPVWLLKLITGTESKSTSDTKRFEPPLVFQDGARNEYLYRTARSAHARYSLNADEILNLLRGINQSRCRPPVEEDELQNIAHNAATQADRPGFESDGVDPAVERLAKLKPLEFDKVCRAEAKKLGVRVTTLRAEVDKARAKHPAPKETPRWAPPPQTHTEPVNGEELIAELVGAIRRFMMVDESGALIAALWVLFTWVFEQIAETNPYLRIISPAPGCGKSTLIKVLRWLTRSGWLLARLTASSFARTMSAERRTLLLDEGDAFLHENEVMRNLLDGASDPDTATISLSEKTGDTWKPIELDVFVPIAIASIGALRKMETVEDRSIAINLKRATGAELKLLDKGRRRMLKAVLEPLALKCAKWAADNAEVLKDARPEVPDTMLGREQDKWEPLIAIADTIGGACAKTARETAARLSASRGDDGTTVSVMLIADLQDERILGGGTDFASTAAILEELHKLEDRPWPAYGRAQKPISAVQLARLLKPFGVFPTSDGRIRGYKRSDLEDAFMRHPANPPSRPVNPSVTPRREGQNEFSDLSSEKAADGLKNNETPWESTVTDTLTDEKVEV